MDPGAIAFYVVAAATIAAALGVVVARSVVYSALLLILALSLTALIYLLLLADFLALVQILIYAGTVSVLLLFALMLTRPERRARLNHRGWPAAAVGAVVVLAILVYQAVATTWTPSVTTSTAPPASVFQAGSGAIPPQEVAGPSAARPGELIRVSPAALGGRLYTTWVVPFEITALVLLVALLGGMLIARSTGEYRREAPPAEPERSEPPAVPVTVERS